MRKRSIQIINEKGLHARAAAKLVKTAQQHNCTLWVRRSVDPEQGDLLRESDGRVNACSILGLMMLGAGKGVMLDLLTDADGAAADAVLDAIIALIEARFGEDA
jgi:phosphocarrier protein HPr